MTIAEFFNKVGFKVNEGDVKKVNDTISGIKDKATKLLGAIGIGFSLANMNALVEEFDAINDKINYTISGLGDVKEAQKGILDAANAVKTSYSDMASVVTNLVKASPEMFPIDEAISFSTNLTKLMKTAGRNDSEIASIMEGMNKSFQKGAVDTETLNKMLEQAPETANYLAERLGVAKTQLLQLATDGKISVNDLKDAFVASSEEIDAAFSQLNFGVSDALLNIRNKWGFWLKETDEMFGITQRLGKFMVSAFDKVIGVVNRARNAVVWFSDKLGGTDKLIRLIAITAGILLTAFNFDKITGGLTSIFKLLGKIKLSTLAIIAVAILIALIVEDFINFMMGNDSVIGSLLEKAGIDTQKVRDTIIAAWNKIKDFLAAAWNAIKDIAKNVWDGLKAFWEKHGESIKAALAAAWETIKTILLTVWNIIKTVATTIFEGLRNFWAKHGEQIKTAFTNIWNGIKNVVTTVWNIIKGLAEVIFNGLAAFWNTWGSTIIAYFTGIWEVIKAVFGTVFNVLTDLFAAFSALFAGDWEGFWSNIGAFFSDLWNGLVNIVGTYLNAIWSVISSVFSVIADFIGGIVSTIWDTIVNAFTSVRDSVAEIFNSIKETVSSVFESLVGIVKAPVNAIINLINGLIDGLNGLSFDIPDWIPGVGGKTFGFNIPHIPALAEGGYLKPNNPQLAIVGDNRTQGEIVAPEGKLLTIMKQALEAFAVNGKIKSGDESQGGNGMTMVLQALNALVAKMMPTPATGAMNAVTQNRSIVQNNVFNNEFNGDTPVQQKASKAMDKSSKDATGELARALAFSR